MKTTFLKRIGTLAMTAVMAFSMAIGASAATETAAIDPSRTASLTLYKYDLTSASLCGGWTTEAHVSTGLYDETVNTALSPYAMEGVEFSYVRVADSSTNTETGSDGTVLPLWGIQDVGFLTALGLTAADACKTEDDIFYFQSDTLIDALSDSLTENATTAKTALEEYLSVHGGTAMPETDAAGKTTADGLAQGLYLVVETRVPEQVTGTTAPFLVSLPMTNQEGDAWNYDVTVYPKNETGSPTLEKTVKESEADPGTADFSHTATASQGDTVDYRILSTLPTITSPATALTTYTFVDTLSKGIAYQKHDVVIEFFTNAACTELVAAWNEGDGTFTVDYTDYDPETGSQMTIEMTDKGLAELSTSEAVYNEDVSLYRGYSNCTMRITYSCTVNSDAAVVCGDSGNPNQVELTWKRTNTSFYDTLKDDCHVYTYGLDLIKQFSDDAGSFKNVKFLLFNATSPQ